MGTVWRAVDEMLHRDVAVKELRLPDHLDDEEKDLARERTMREARAAARVGHPNVVVIHDVVEEGGIPWIVMELVEAQSLAEILETQGTLTPADAADLGLKVLDALLAADAKGVLHRDVKPANILVTTHGRVVLTDFGIATATGTATLTMTGMLVGSPDFLAPERAEGKRPGLAADLWSLAVVLYMAVEGRNPFRRGTMISTLNAILTDEADPPRHAAGLGPVIDGWLVKDADLRMSAEEGARILREVADSTPSRQFGALPPEVGPVPPPPRAADVPAAPPSAYQAHEHALPGFDSGAAQHPGGNTPPSAWPTPQYPPADPATQPGGVPGGGLPPHTPRDPYTSAPPRPSGGRGRVIAVVALVVALIAGGVVVGILASGGDDKDNKAAPSPTVDATAGSSNSNPNSNSNPTAPPPSSGLPTSSPSASDRPKAPSGYEAVADPDGFTVNLPKGSTRSLTGPKRDQIKYVSPDRKTVYLFGTTRIPNGPLDNFTDSVEPQARSKPGYDRLQLRSYTPLPPGTLEAALWEYTWNGDPIGGDTTKSVASHALNLGIRTNAGKDYALYAASYESDWTVTKERFQVMTDSFRSS
jgi:serine/threonine protein kinase